MSVKYKTIEVNGIKVPATFHDAILKIKDGFQRGRVNFVAAARYVVYDEDTDKVVYSPIGYLFNNAQREAICAADDASEQPYSMNVEELADAFGIKNIATVTGMTVSDGLELQEFFDYIGTQYYEGSDPRTDFNNALNELLKRPNYDNPGLKYIS